MRLPFDEQEVRAAFDGATFQRGRHYALDGAVRGLEVSGDGRQLWAQVRGSAQRPYRVEVTVADGRGRRVVSYCTCPIGSQCKHGVAVMLSALRSAGSPPSSLPLPARLSPRPASPPDPLVGPVGDWLKLLGEALGDARNSAGPPSEQVIYLLTTRQEGTRTTAMLLPRVTRRLKAGGWGAEREYHATTLAASTASFVKPRGRPDRPAAGATVASVELDAGRPGHRRSAPRAGAGHGSLPLAGEGWPGATTRPRAPR